MADRYYLTADTTIVMHYEGTEIFSYIGTPPLPINLADWTLVGPANEYVLPVDPNPFPANQYAALVLAGFSTSEATAISGYTP